MHTSEKQRSPVDVVQSTATRIVGLTYPRGCVKQWQGQEAPLKRAIEATESECLRYKEQWKDLNAKMTFKRGLAAECQKSIDINQAQLDQVNKRLRHFFPSE